MVQNDQGNQSHIFGKNGGNEKVKNVIFQKKVNGMERPVGVLSRDFVWSRLREGDSNRARASHVPLCCQWERWPAMAGRRRRSRGSENKKNAEPVENMTPKSIYPIWGHGMV